MSRMLNKHHIHLVYSVYNQEVLRFEPPLNVRKEEIDRATEALDETCSKSAPGLIVGAYTTALGRILSPP
jgi:acetylornithine/succinyldiaminopimelate/putrescine aminotransferase